jgi:creatinine amidohydrolase
VREDEDVLELAALSFGEARAAIERGAIALWPIGSTEAHGPHLPLDTDVVIARTICSRASTAIAARFGVEVLILPPLAFTVTEFARPFAGTISISRDTVLAYVRDVAASVASLGVRGVCLVNGHLEPAHRYMLRDAVTAARAAAACPVMLADPSDRRFAPSLGEEFQKSAHAGRYETSLVLAADPSRVRLELVSGLPALDVDLVSMMRAGAKNFLEVGAADAYLGDPRAASAAEGEALYSRLVEIVVTVIEDSLKRSEG